MWSFSPLGTRINMVHGLPFPAKNERTKYSR